MRSCWGMAYLAVVFLAAVFLAATSAAEESSSCPASSEERQAHAVPVLDRGERPWAMSPLPARPPAAPKVLLPPPHTDERRLWVRRLTFVLSGLPPREDDVEAFLADRSPAALDKVLDRLLAAATAPQRLTEVWLRAAGHADRWPDAPSPSATLPTEAWLYRDWVVTQLRTTPDVRRLARLTLAGDSQPGPKQGVPNRSGLLATLWHVTAAPTSSDFEQTVVDWTGRQAERTARTFLGIDLTCARCHDHPTLPLPSDEAAGLVAIFAHSHAFVPGPGGAPERHRISTASPEVRQKRSRALENIAAEQAKLDSQRQEFALATAAEFLPQTAEYVRAAWAWHRNPSGTLAAFSATRGLLDEPLARWLVALGLTGEPPPHSLAAPWWAAWTEATETGTADAIAAVARTVQEIHRADIQSPFFTTSPTMDAFFTLDQQTQLARQEGKIAALRRALPDDASIPALAEGSPPGMEPPAMLPILPSLLTGGDASTPINPPGSGRRALATWLEGEGATFFARLAAIRLAEGVGHPLLPEPSALRLWTATRPPGADVVDDVAACLVAGGWPAAAKRLLQHQSNDPSRLPLAMGASEWSDAVLFAAGTLDPRQGGPPDPAPDSPRRSLYREWAPLPARPTPAFLESQAAALATLAHRKAGADPAVQLTWLTHHLFQRPPTPAERTSAQAGTHDLAGFCATALHSEEFRTFP